MRPRIRRIAVGVALIGSIVSVTIGNAAPPEMLTHPFYESPVRGGPDDILMLSGTGFVSTQKVVYQRSDWTTPPSTVPTTSDGDLGEATVLLTLPHAMTVRLPLGASGFNGDRAYKMWVFDGTTRSSDSVQINDARPLWFSPARIAKSQDSPAYGDRTLKVVGRNQNPAPGLSGYPKVRLTKVAGAGCETTTVGSAISAGTGSGRHVTNVPLPTITKTGSYCVWLARDEVSSAPNWVVVPNQRLEVVSDITPDPIHLEDVSGTDDTQAIRAALDDAATVATATVPVTVVLEAGEWHLNPSSEADRDPLSIAANVNLVGEGRSLTSVIRHEQWDVDTVFYVESGPSTIEGIKFIDESPAPDIVDHEPDCDSHPCTKFFELQAELREIKDVSFIDNQFEDMFVAISDNIHMGGASYPITRLAIAGNIFQSFAENIRIWGNPDIDAAHPFWIADSVIRANTFHPGDYAPGNHQGVMGSGIGSSRRVAFIDNEAKRTNLADAHKGWRSAFFWHMCNSSEMLLIGGNTGTCTGDVGTSTSPVDGELISLDSNRNTMGYGEVMPILSSGSNYVVVCGAPEFHPGQWIQVVAGPGMGQTRPIKSSPTSDPTTACPTAYKLEIATDAPAWDIQPVANQSRVTVSRQFWQTYVLDNVSDNDAEGACLDPGGTIALFASFADAVVEGNEMYDSEGILLDGGSKTMGCHDHLVGGAPYFCVSDADGSVPACADQCGAEEIMCCHYPPPEEQLAEPAIRCETTCDEDWSPCPPCQAPNAHRQFFNDVRGNTILGEHDFDEPDSVSGVIFNYGSVDYADSGAVGFGVSIVDNVIEEADDLYSGAISFRPGWLRPLNDYQFRNTILQRNDISKIKRDDCTNRACVFTEGADGYGVYIAETYTQETVMDNIFPGSTHADRNCWNIRDHGTATLNLDEPPSTNCGLSSGLQFDCSPCNEINCSSTDLVDVSCKLADNTSYNCACTSDDSLTLLREACFCSSGGICPFNINRLICQ